MTKQEEKDVGKSILANVTAHIHIKGVQREAVEVLDTGESSEKMLTKISRAAQGALHD